MSSSSSSATLAAVGGAEDMVTAVIDELKKTQEWRQNSFLPNSVLEVEVRFGRLRAREGNEYAVRQLEALRTRSSATESSTSLGASKPKPSFRRFRREDANFPFNFEPSIDRETFGAIYAVVENDRQRSLLLEGGAGSSSSGIAATAGPKNGSCPAAGSAGGTSSSGTRATYSVQVDNIFKFGGNKGGKKGKGKKGGYQSLPARNCRAVELLAYDPDDSDDGEGSPFSSELRRPKWGENGAAGRHNRRSPNDDRPLAHQNRPLEESETTARATAARSRSRSREREQRQARTDHGGRREFAPASLRDMRLEEKEKLVMLDFLNVGGGPFDLRVSLSREKDLESERAKIESELGPEPQKNRKFTCVRKKRRFSYRSPAFPEASLDLTRVKQFGAAKNHAETREIEIELDAEAVRKAIEFGAEECARPLVSSLISVATTIASTDLAQDLGKSLFKAEAGPEAGVLLNIPEQRLAPEYYEDS